MKETWACPQCPKTVTVYIPLTMAPICSKHMGKKPVLMKKREKGK